LNERLELIIKLIKESQYSSKEESGREMHVASCKRQLTVNEMYGTR